MLPGETCLRGDYRVHLVAFRFDPESDLEGPAAIAMIDSRNADPLAFLRLQAEPAWQRLFVGPDRPSVKSQSCFVLGERQGASTLRQRVFYAEPRFLRRLPGCRAATVGCGEGTGMYVAETYAPEARPGGDGTHASPFSAGGIPPAGSIYGEILRQASLAPLRLYVQSPGGADDAEAVATRGGPRATARQIASELRRADGLSESTTTVDDATGAFAIDTNAKGLQWLIAREDVLRIEGCVD